MSIANAINVRRAARKDKMDAMSVTVTWLEKEKSNAMKVTAVARKTDFSKVTHQRGTKEAYQRGVQLVHGSKSR